MVEKCPVNLLRRIFRELLLDKKNPQVTLKKNSSDMWIPEKIVYGFDIKKNLNE